MVIPQAYHIIFSHELGWHPAYINSQIHLPDLTSLSYSGTGSLDLHPDDRPDLYAHFLYTLFRNCRAASLTSLSLSGNISLGLLEVHFLVPLLLRLQSLSLNLDSVPPDFWMSMSLHGIFIKERFALTTWEPEAAVFNYLCSYIGLKHLFLRIKDGKDDERVNSVMQKHRTTLISTNIAKPSSLVRYHIWIGSHPQRYGTY